MSASFPPDQHVRSSTNRRSRFAAALAGILSVALALLCGVPQAAAAERPNILLIMADDLGFSDLGCYGGEIQTPNLDALAQGGLRFTQFYNTGRCWPTRGALLTGYYAQQIRRDFLPGIPTGGGNRGRRPDWAVLLPEMLSRVGYRSYHTGKWHIDGQPTANGFDKSSLTRVGRYFQPKPGKDGRNGRPLEFRDDYYLTTAMADDAIANLKAHAEKTPDQPFFQYLAFTAPHFPLHALPEDIAIYDEIYRQGWDAIRAQRWRRMRAMGLLDDTANPKPSPVERDLGPPYHFPEAFEILGEGEINRPLPWNQLTDQQQAFQAKKMAIHAAMIHRMDLAIGRVFEQIRKMDRWDDTLILFLSDNGASAEIMVRGDGHDPAQPPGSALTYLCLGPGWSTACNTPFRRHKTWTHEGGISTPLIVSWPKRIRDAGGFRRNPHHVIDVVETVLELTAAEHPENAPESPGQSFLPELADDPRAEPRTLWWYHDGHRAIRQGQWKAVAPEGEPWELYHLGEDRIESVDLAIVHPEKLSELKNAWHAQLEDSIRLASRDLDQPVARQTSENHRSGKMWEAQQAARVKRHQVLPNGEVFRLKDRYAFVMKPDAPASNDDGKPWIFYAPALSRYPDKHERWMHQQFLSAGVAVAGIDIGEAYGSPHSTPFFDALYKEMVRRGYSRKPALLGRSRGGLWVSRFAIDHPERVAAIGGIYPVFDYTTYPGVERAAAVYGLSPDALRERHDEFNPIRLAGKLAAADLPVRIIHGKDDRVVPLKQNSAALAELYRQAGKEQLISVEEIDGQGHNFWPGFFHSQPLVDFLIAAAKGN
jgi:arylsulfatase